MLRRGVILFVLAALFVSVISVAGVAYISDCGSGNFCAWVNTSYGGTPYQVFGSDNNWPGWIDNDEESVYNHGTTGMVVTVFDYNYKLGDLYCVLSGQAFSSLSHPNDGNSHGWYYYCTS